MFDPFMYNKTAQLIVAGALGGLVRWLTLRDHWTDGLISIIVGAVCSAYVSPLVIPALTPLTGAVDISTESIIGLSGFLVGVGGITVSGMIMDAWRKQRKLRKEATSSEDKKS